MLNKDAKVSEYLTWSQIDAARVGHGITLKGIPKMPDYTNYSSLKMPERIYKSRYMEVNSFIYIKIYSFKRSEPSFSHLHAQMSFQQMGFTTNKYNKQPELLKV